MSKMHIWVGNFKSEEEFEKYLDQKKYLKAWAVYNNEPPTGNEEEDSEPDPALRCEFCKEVNLDTYDEDFMIIKYYTKSVDVKTIADDILADGDELAKLWKKHTINSINVVIAYEDNDLSEKAAANSTTVQYLGKINQVSDTDAEIGVHHLWVGDNELKKKEIIEKINSDKNEILDVNFYYNKKKQKLDEMIITQIEDFNVAEKMILTIDEMKIPAEANAILDLFVNQNSKIDGGKIGTLLGMRYIGKFDVE